MTEKPRTKSSYAKPLALTPFKSFVPLSNPYSALASPSRSYAQAAQKWSPPSSSVSPAQPRPVPVQSSPQRPSLPRKPITNPYFNKACSITDKFLEKDELNHERTPQLPRIFPSINGKITQFHIPKGYQNPPKTQEYYEFILVDTDSAEITHKKEEDSERVAYSKCKIMKFITKEEWGNPYMPRTFSQRYLPPQYNYFDYEEAWYNTFYLRPCDHSWFFSFCQKFNRKIPSWVHQWWIYFGLNREVLPEDVQKGWNHFHEKIKTVSYGNKSIMFAVEFQVPWIIAWDFAISGTLDHQHPLILEKRFRIKWWRNFQPGDRFSIPNIDLWITAINNPSQIPTPEKYAPASSSKPLSKKELKKKLLEEISQLGDSDEEDEGSSQPTPAPVFMQFAQDPYEDYDPSN